MITRIEEIPVTNTSYPFTSAKRYGYLEEAQYKESEYYMYGTSNVYQTEPDGRIGIRFADAPYVNRFIVRRPADADRFSGNIVVEIINPTSGIDLERMWMLGLRQFMRSGDIYIGITSKPNTIRPMKLFDPERYAKMDWSNPTPDVPFPFTAEDIRSMPNLLSDQDIGFETGLFWDMLTDLGKLLRSDDKKNPLRSLIPQTIVLTGWSQSACYLIRYLNDFAYKDMPHSVYDGFLAAGPPRHLPTPVNQYETIQCAKRDTVQIKGVKEPCIVLQTESENAALGAANTVRQDGYEPDFQCRHYDITGASHDTEYTLIDYYRQDPDLARIGFAFSYAGNDAEPNNYPTEIIAGAMFRNLFVWIHDGTAPQPCRRIPYDHNGANKKDALGNSLGGIRTCLLDLPTGRFFSFSHILKGDSAIRLEPEIEPLFGHEEAFPPEMLKYMYSSLDHYRKLVTENTALQISRGFVVKEDGDALIEAAVERARRRGLT